MLHAIQRVGASLALGLAVLAGVAAADEATAPATATEPAPAPPPVRVLLHTAAGDLVLALDAEHAPLTSANFLRYVDARRYDGGEFYRAVKLDADGRYGLVQGGVHAGRLKPFRPVAHEAPAQTGLRHVDGAVSMARHDPGTATSEFFIVIGELTALDGQGDDPGYAVFGHVESGMEVIRPMLDLPRNLDGPMPGESLSSPVKILSARRLPPAAP